ncbi:ABC transporter permease [Haploplasma axanthum]|uniref:Polyamine (Spermidine/putrescine) ABC transporter permease n=1 Tax=Haploplasma axanthum TaxID=29552 RepID=A0A449BDR7_HAPAX|nr:ABC transporter permease [Haploplasma axanthum]VEU80604.1 polyamine (spermidine/putrescine) ABC transporter permease [Haploplasma axanthum]
MSKFSKDISFRGIKKIKNKRPMALLGVPYYIVLTLLIVLPFLIMVLYAFNSTSDGTYEITFSILNFKRFITEPLFINTMLESLYLAALSTIFTLLIGYPLAYFITKLSNRKQILMIALVTSPMWINMLLRANAIKQVVDLLMPSLLGTDFIIVLGNVYMFLPFMVLPIYTVLAKLDPSLLESSADLGASNFKTMVKVVIPLSLSGVISGCMMVFLPAATTLVIPKYLGDGKRTMIGNLIENAVLTKHEYGYAAAISIILGLILMTFVFLLKKVDKYDEVLSREEI